MNDLKLGLGLIACFFLMVLAGAGCSEVDFQQAPNSSTGGITTPPPPPPPPGGEVKSSYFFVKRAADILFVVDSSGSMAEEQSMLQNGFPSFTSALNTFSGGTLMWHVAITTTDIATAGPGNQGNLVEFSRMASGTYFLDSAMDVNRANDSFQASVMVGTAGTGDERGIAAARLVAQREFSSATTRGFIRADTPLSVIVISDEDERSTRDTTNSQYRDFEPIDEPANFVTGIRALDSMSAAPKTITFHSLVTSTKACLNGAGQQMGTTYMDLSTRTNGIIGDVCATALSYQDQLNSLASSIVNEARTYTLPCNSILAGSVTAYEQTPAGALVIVPSTFVAPNKMVLQTAPPVGSLIKAKFTCMD
jgi:hypothetical protein